MNWPNLTDEEKERLKNYKSPYEINMLERLDGYNERELMKTFIQFLNKQEESDSGRVFRPNCISSCRVLDSMEMGEILKRLNISLFGEERDES